MVCLAWTNSEIRAQNTAPIGIPDLYTIEVNGTLVVSTATGFLSNDYDPDGDSFSVTSGLLPDNGDLALQPDGSFTYTPDPDFTGTDSFQYRIRDSGGLTAPLTTVTVEVLPSVNRAPTAVADGYSTPFDTQLSVDAAAGLLTNDYDLDGDNLFVGAFTSPANGSVSVNISTGAFTYTPDDDFAGIDSFQYRVRDPDFAISALVTVTIDVQPALNRSPVAYENYYGTPVSTPLSVPAASGLLTNDTDPDGDTIFVGAFTSPDNGTVSVNISTGALTYTPDAGFVGVDVFEYRIRDPDFAISALVEVRVAVGTPVLLDVELTTFDAVSADEFVRLTWNTASETNNAGFEIERQDGTEPFESVGFVEGAGTSSTPRSYSFSDMEVPFTNSELRYRLRQVDYDGSVTYSPIVAVERGTPDALTLHEAFPNPFASRTTIRYELAAAARVRLTIFDLQGRVVQRVVDRPQAAGRYDVPFDASGLASGSYIYAIETDGRGSAREVRRMTVVK